MVKKDTTVLEIRPVEIEIVALRIVGDTPLIVHRWSEKAMRMMLEKQMKTTKAKGRDAKDPVEDFINSLYWMSGKPAEPTEDAFTEALSNGAAFGFPVTAIKQAAISAAFRNGLSKDKVSLQGAFFIRGEGEELLAQVHGTPHMREDMVRVGMGTADIRFRGQFDEWYMDLQVSYNRNGQYTIEQIINLINIGGYSCGIGEWRPEKSGQNGMYHVSAG